MAATAYAASTTDTRNKRERYAALRAKLWSDRSSFDSHWSELGQFLQPRRTRFFASDRNRGDKRNQHILDSTARFAVRTLASGLHAGLTSPARPWMKLTTPDPDLAEHAPVKAWLHVVTQRLLTVFATSNLYNVLPTIYADMGVFGTAAMAVLDDTRDPFRCYAYPIGSYALGLDSRNLATTFCREFQLTVRQVVEMFGGPGGTPLERTRAIDWTNISHATRAAWDQGNYETSVDVTWIVKPNDDADPDRLPAKYLPWASCYFESGAEEKQFLRESGFREFPILAPRWDVTGEDTYGTDCPGMTALGDVKQLQLMQKKKGQAIAKIIDPPLVGPPELRTQKTSLLPGDITYLAARDGMQGLRSIHEINLNLDHLRLDVSQVQYSIRRAFYEDLFLLTSDASTNQPVTAREIDERHEEKLLALGPVLERTNDELLDPLVDRAYAILERAGLIPAPPTILHGVTLKVEYTSILAQAQKIVGVSAQDRLLSTILPIAEVHPDVLQKIDFDRLIDNYGEGLGVDPRVIVPTELAQARIAESRKQAAEAQQAEVAKNYGIAAKNAAQAPVTGDTALSRIVDAAASGAAA